MSTDERERIAVRRDDRDQRVTDYLVAAVTVIAPAVNLLALGNRSWPFIAWLVVGAVVAAAYFLRRSVR